MEKVKFNNKIFEYSLIGYLIILLSWNLYALSTGNTKALIQLIFLSTLLILIFLKNKYAKIGIYFFAFIIILGNGLSFIAKIIKIMLGDEIIMSEIINKALFLIVGILIYTFNKSYVEIVKL